MTKKDCEHKNKLTVYGRSQGVKKNWISAYKIKGKTVYICEDCGDIFQDESKEVEVKKNE
jgi:hypothetical protein